MEYTFKHAVTQEVAYHSVLNERRKRLHERAAAAIEALGAGRVEDQLMEVAHHYSRSGNVGKAVEYLGRAGQRAARRRRRMGKRCPRATALCHNALPGSEMVIFEKSSHLPFFEEPDKYLKVVRDFIYRAEHRAAAP